AAQVRLAATPQGGSADQGRVVVRPSLQRVTAALLVGQRRDSTVEEEPAGPEESASSRLGHSFSRLTIYPRTAAKTTVAQSLPNGQAPEVAGISRLPLRGEAVPYRARMEQAFGADFSTVNAFRAESALLASFGARAAAWPEAVAFASATPSPQMVAHELAHVLQYRHSQHPTSGPQGAVRNGNPTEVEARHAATHVDAGMLVRPRACPQAVPMLYTDEEDLDSEEYLQERSPQFTNQEVGTWGNSWPASLIARERIDISFPERERS
ncbi:MAG: DUF4157 domain-containing protein, partial [Nitrospira defluvii]|nr:DUF4157 domain-containing protein [Nitrospira defluvii]